MATGVYRRAVDAEHAANAFRFVVQAWLETRAEACLTAASICALDVMALGGLWWVLRAGYALCWGAWGQRQVQCALLC